MDFDTVYQQQSNQSGYLEGQLLVATPNISSGNFQRSLILILAHNEEGAMGVTINQTLPDVSYGDLIQQLQNENTNFAPVNTNAIDMDSPVNYGGPVEINRGFVVYLHENKFLDQVMLTLDNIAVSASIDILQTIAEGKGPKDYLLVIGYAGWSPGQLEDEIESNCWFSVPLDESLVFSSDNDSKWKRAADSIGLDMTKLSTTAGHA